MYFHGAGTSRLAVVLPTFALSAARGRRAGCRGSSVRLCQQARSMACARPACIGCRDTVDAAQLLSRKQLVDWQYDLDERNLRATGSPRHEAYIDALHERLLRAGVKQLRFEPVSLRQWSVEAEHWGLEVLDGERPGVLPSVGYIPYSGVTPPSGIAGRIVYLAPDSKPDASLAGKLVLVQAAGPR